MAGQESQSPFSNIQRDILSNILKRLPAKCLMRFKCVHKQWQTLISDPHFAHLHHTFSLSRIDASHLLFLVNDYKRRSRTHDPRIHSFIPTNLEGNLDYFHRIPKHSLNGRYTCSNIVNGLVCCFMASSMDQQLSMLNLTTAETIVLPPLPSSTIFYSSYKFFLGFDPLSNRYKVLMLRETSTILDPTDSQILTLATTSWRQLDYCPEDISLSDHTFVDGRMYWIQDEENYVIINCFDLRDEKFGILSPPEEVSWVHQPTHVGTRFALVSSPLDYYYSNDFELWMLNHEDNVWSKNVIKLEMYGVPLSRDEVRVFGTIRTGELLITRNSGCHEKMVLMFYDFEAKERKICEISRRQHVDLIFEPKIVVLVENIVPLSSLCKEDEE